MRMTATRRLEIRRIYSVTPAKAAVVSAGRAAPLQVSVLGILSLAVAASWIYAAWWPGDRFATRNLMMTGLAVPMAGGGLGLDGLLGLVPEDLADPAPPEGTEAADFGDAAEFGPAMTTAGPEEIEAGQATMRSLYIDMWVWLVVTSVAGAWLAMAGGAAVAGFPVTDQAKRRAMFLAAAIAAVLASVVARQLWHGRSVLGLTGVVPELALVGLAVLVAYVLAVCLSTRTAGLAAGALGLGLVVVGGLAWRDWYTGTQAICESYPASAPRIAAVAALVVAGLAGAAMFRRSNTLQRGAVVLMLAAAITTVAALKYAESAGGLHSDGLTGSAYALVVLAQLSYAAVLVGAQVLRTR